MGFEIEVEDGFMKSGESPKPIVVETEECDARRELIATGCSRASSYFSGEEMVVPQLSTPTADIRTPR